MLILSKITNGGDDADHDDVLWAILYVMIMIMIVIKSFFVRLAVLITLFRYQLIDNYVCALVCVSSSSCVCICVYVIKLSLSLSLSHTHTHTRERMQDSPTKVDECQDLRRQS